MRKDRDYFVRVSLVLGLVMSSCEAANNSLRSVNNPRDNEPTRLVDDQLGIETRSRPEEIMYPLHQNIVASVFWIGESAGEDNAFIDNVATAWTENAVVVFGGIDDPDNRNPNYPFYPEGFTPKENPFYVALPAGEFDETGPIPNARERSPWASEAAPNGSLFKNRWVKVIRTLPDGSEAVCYAQWEDVGPLEETDYDYVFGDAQPANSDGLGAGIDLSPACAISIGLDNNTSQQSAIVDWHFIDEINVPDGPWKDIVTTSGPDWD